MNALKAQRVEERGEKKRLHEYWKQVAKDGWRNKLHVIIKSGAPPPPGTYIGVYKGTVAPMCIFNQRLRVWKQKLKKDARDSRWQMIGETSQIPHEMLRSPPNLISMPDGSQHQ